MRIRNGTLGLLGLILLLVPLTLVSPADAGQKRIVIGRSIAGVKPGQSLDRVHGILGQPRAVKYKPSEILGTVRFDYFRKVEVASYNGTAISVKTTRRSIRTRSGIGVGTSKRKLRRSLPKLNCYGATCSLTRNGGPARAGSFVTVFRVRKDKVRSVLVGRVID